jgi:ABC-type transport system involved in multi-copper enzyme maturation permease subunit
MTFLPIVARELRVASRRHGTYWVRTGAALAVIVVGTWLFLVMREESSKDIAIGLFGVLTGSAVLYCLLSGVRSTADCLSEEKREGTLGLLFLTDLKGYDVVFGKLVATSLNAFYAVLAVVPMLAIPLLMGGVALGEFGRMALVAVNTLFFSLAVGMYVSSISRNARQAMGLSFLLLMIFTVVLPACGSWNMLFGRAQSPEILFLLPSPGFTYFRAWDKPFQAAQEQFWWSIGVIHGLAWVFLGMASVIAPRAWKDRPAGVKRLRWRERWRMWSYGDLADRRAFRKRLLDTNAFFWLAARARLKPACVWAVLCLLGCGWAWGLAKFRREWLSEPMYVITGLVLNLLIKGWFASEAGRQLAEDRLHGTMELLLSTPLTVRDFLHGQFLALARQFLGPVLLVLGAFVAFMLAARTEYLDNREYTSWIMFWVGGMAMLVVDLIALYWVGMWLALTARNPHRAASGSLARILVLPWIILAILGLLVSLSVISTRSSPSGNFFLCLWFLVGVFVDLFFGLRARHKILTEFRQVASQRYAARPGLFKRIFGGSSAPAAGAPPGVPAAK